MPLNANLLTQLLCEYGVDTEQWGAGQAKTVGDLLQEIRTGECYLKVVPAGLFRVLEIVKAWIYNAAGDVLLECGQYLPDGRYRERKQVPAGKMRQGESPLQALDREMKEELGIGRFNAKFFLALEPLWENRPSPSYPGLTCLYQVYPFKMEVPDHLEICRSREFERTEDNGTRLIFKWVSGDI